MTIFGHCPRDMMQVGSQRLPLAMLESHILHTYFQ